jgi:HSP20 family molecular chaperone IbpA
MTDLMRQERPALIDLFQWLDSEFPTFRSLSAAEHMRVEDFVEDDHYVLRAELPGLDPDNDVDITVNDGVLTVKAERREETKTERRSEFHYGSFARRVALPAGADEDDVAATYDKGVLEIRVGIKKESAPEPRHITVTRI